MANTVEIVIKAIDKASGTIMGVEKRLGGLASLSTGIVGALGKTALMATAAVVGVGAGAVALGKDAIQTSIDYETAFAGIIKTTDGLTSSFGVLNEAGQELKQGFKDLAETKPLPPEELMHIGEIGGQLGIAKEHLLDFAGVIADLSVSTALSSEAGAMGLARFMNIMNTAGGDVGRLGSTIVDLGNNFATTEPEILAMGTRLAGAAKVAGISEAAVLGIATAFSSVGVQAEAGGTAVQKVFLDMHQLAIQGEDALAGYAEAAGMSAGEFAKLWKEDAGGAFTAFVSGLSAQGDRAAQTLDELGIKDQRQIRSFLAVAGAGDLMARSVGLATEAWEENTALTIEAGERYATTASQMDMLKNQFRNVKDTIGTTLLPVFRNVMDVFSELTRKHGPAIVEMLQKKLVPALEKIGDAIGLLAQGQWQDAIRALFPPEMAEKILTIVDAVHSFIDVAATWVQEHWPQLEQALIAFGSILAAGVIATSIASIVSTIASLANPVGLIIAAVGLLAAAWINDWGGIQEKTAAVVDWLRGAIAAVTGWMSNAWQEHGVEVAEHWTAMWAAIMDRAQTIIGAVQGIVGPALEAIQAWWQQHGDQVLRILGLYWDNVKALFETAFTALREFGLMIMAAIAGDWESAGEHWTKVVEALWEGIQRIFSNSIKILWELIRELVKTIQDIVKRVDWKQLGKDIINGIKDGVLAKAQSLVDAVVKAARDAITGVQKFLGIGSPSRVAAEQVGKPFVEGIALGMKKQMAVLTRLQLPQMTAQMVSGAQQGSQTSNATVYNNYNLYVHTNAPVEPILADFAMMRAMA